VMAVSFHSIFLQTQLLWYVLVHCPAGNMRDLRAWCTILYAALCWNFIRKLYKTNSVALSPQANYTDWATATCLWNLVAAFVDRRVSRGQCGGSLTVVNLSFLDRSHYFSFK
jgi:hypothetical protein